MLFLQITDDYKAVFPHIKALANVFGIEVELCEYTTYEKLQEDLASYTSPFDYIYIGAHGNENGIATASSGGDYIRWADFAIDICSTAGLTEHSVIFLGCCYGGIRRGAIILLSLCDTIHHVCGAQCSINAHEIGLAFHTYIFHHLRDVEAETIKKRVAKAVGKGFDVFSRYNMDIEIAQAWQLIDSGSYLPDHFRTSVELEWREAPTDEAGAPLPKSVLDSTGNTTMQ